MGPAAFVIAILGCADGGSACTSIETLPVQYRTEAACAAAAPAALYRDGASYDFPTVVAQCQPQAGVRTASQPRGRRITDGGRSG